MRRYGVDRRVLETERYAPPVEAEAEHAKGYAILGRPVRGLEIRVVDPATGHQLADREVGELVDDDVVDHPVGEGGQTRGDSNMAGGGRARTPAADHVVGPADVTRSRQFVAAGKRRRAGGEIDSGHALQLR